MKSFWKSLLKSALLIAVSAASASILAAQDEQPGLVRIVKSTSLNVDNQLMPVSATQMSGSCIPSNGSCVPSAGGAGMMGGPCSSGYCDPSMGGMNNGMSGGMSNGQYGGMYNGQYGGSNGVMNNGQYGDMNGCPYDPYMGYNNGGRRKNRYADGAYDGNDGMGGRRYRHGHHFGHGYGGCPGGCYGLCAYLRCKFGCFIPTGGGGPGLPWVGHYSRVYPVNPAYSDPRDGQVWTAQGYGIPVSVPLAPVVGHTWDYSWGVPSSRLTPISRPAF
jgi:hypothetical protein